MSVTYKEEAPRIPMCYAVSTGKYLLGVSKLQTDFLNMKLKGLRPFEMSVTLLVYTA